MLKPWGRNTTVAPTIFFDHFLSKIGKNIADFFVNNHLCNLVVASIHLIRISYIRYHAL